MAVEFTDANFKELVLESDKPVLVYPILILIP